MEVVNGLSDLINNEAFVFFFQNIFSYQGIEVDVHKLEDEVDVALVLSFDYFLKGDDVRMLDLIEEHDFAVRALGVSGVLERVEVLFQCVNCLVFFVDHFPYDAVSSTSDFFDNFIPLQDVRFDFIVGLAHADS
jgi:hypothetical protein